MNDDNILKEGDIAPDFLLPGSDGREHKLSDYIGKNVILYFYPRDNTPGCTLEATGFRDSIEDFSKLDAIVIGISRDSLESHEKFITKQNLPFLLLSDNTETVCKLYDVLKEKNMYGKKSIGIERSTFIIDKQGRFSKIYRKVKVTAHIARVLEDLKSL